MDYHEPVLVETVTRLLNPGPGLYLDGTLGGGGHAHALLTAHPECRVIGVDRDPEALQEAGGRLAPFEDRVTLVHARFDEAVDLAEVQGGLKGVLLDLGVSSHQLDADERGFTLRAGAPLDMRMNQAEGDTAAQVLATASHKTLTEVFRDGEVKRPGALAKRIIDRREDHPYLVSDDLVGSLEGHLGRPARHGEKATLFQALRVFVNQELQVLADALPRLRDALLPGGVIVVMAYQSLEDRIVKRAFREWSDPFHGLPDRLPVRHSDVEAAGEVVTKKPILASEDECAANPRAKPVRVRAWRKAA